MDGQPQQALLDASSFITLTCPEALCPDIVPITTVDITCVHRNVCRVLAVEVALGNGQHEWLIMLGIVPELPVPLLVDRDRRGFPEVGRGQCLQPGPLACVMTTGS